MNARLVSYESVPRLNLSTHPDHTIAIQENWASERPKVLLQSSRFLYIHAESTALKRKKVPHYSAKRPFEAT
jgi:hypothetical protein